MRLCPFSNPVPLSLLQFSLNLRIIGYAIRRALRQHQYHLERLLTERDALLSWLAQLEVDNGTHPNPVQVRWLLDGGFGDAANVTHLIEMGYDLYAIAHNGKTTQALLKQVPEAAQWTQAGVRTQALDMHQRIC